MELLATEESLFIENTKIPRRSKKLLCRNDKEVPRRSKKSFSVGMTLRFLDEAKKASLSE
jgi:hypothetical protein